MNNQELEELFGFMENSDGTKVKVILVAPEATDGKIANAIPTADPKTFYIALNAEALLLHCLKLLDEGADGDKLLNAIAEICIEAVENCPLELNLEEL
jgi:hypothetical protein